MKDYILDLDKPRELRFGFKALRRIREKFGNKSMSDLMNIEVDEIPILILQGIRWEEKELTLEQVEDLLDAAIPKKYTVLGLTTIVLEALAAHMGIDTKKVIADDLEKKKKKETQQVKGKIPSTKKQKKQH